MTSENQRFYGELADWWPLISPVEDYEEESAFAARLLRSASGEVREVLELGSGGGHNAAHLKAHFEITLTDLSPEMIEVSRTLNPECEHHVGDMRSLRLGRTFDAVFIHDAIDYMTTKADLRAALTTAYEHCRVGGVAVMMPDDLRETWGPSATDGELEDADCGGSDAPDGRGVRYLEWSWDPDPSDSWVQTEYVFVLRSADSEVRTVHESHRTGLFRRQTWLDVLSEVGFRPQITIEETTEERPPREIFLAFRDE